MLVRGAVCTLVDKGDAMPKATSKLSWSAVQESYVCVSPPSGEARLVCLAGRTVFLCLPRPGGFLYGTPGGRATGGALLVCAPAHGPAGAQEVSGQDRRSDPGPARADRTVAAS